MYLFLDNLQSPHQWHQGPKARVFARRAGSDSCIHRRRGRKKVPIGDDGRKVLARTYMMKWWSRRSIPRAEQDLGENSHPQDVANDSQTSLFSVSHYAKCPSIRVSPFEFLIYFNFVWDFFTDPAQCPLYLPFVFGRIVYYQNGATRSPVADTIWGTTLYVNYFPQNTYDAKTFPHLRKNYFPPGKWYPN